MEVLFLLVGQEIAGGTILFPSVYTVWNESKSGFQHIPALHCEDFAIFEKFMGQGLGRRLLDETIILSNRNKFGMPNAAIVGEHSKHAGAMGKMFHRLSADVAPDVETILVFY